MRTLVSPVAFGVITLTLAGCTTYRDELGRAQTAYDGNEHELALALTKAIGPNEGRLRSEERTRYAYLRGMSNFRIGFRAEARHYLGIARALETDHPGALSPDMKARLDETLTTLNSDVHASGYAALTTEEATAAKKKK